MTGNELQRLCRLWQKRLRLADWDISASFATEQEMPDAEGEIPYDTAELTATIRVRDNENTERTLVHELLHLRVIPLWDGSPGGPDHDAKETALNLLADSFVRAYPRRANANRAGKRSKTEKA